VVGSFITCEMLRKAPDTFFEIHSQARYAKVPELKA